MKFNRTQSRNLILILLIVALIPAILFGEPRVIEGQNGGDPWRNIIFDFQTLFGGILAVFAAWWTVATMEATDQSAAMRHREVVEWNLITDRRRLSRAIDPQLSVLKNVLSEVLLIDEMERNRDPEDREYWTKWALKATQVHAAVYDVLRRPQFTGASDLFDGQLTRHIWTLNVAAEKVASDAKTAAYYSVNEFSGPDDYDDYVTWNSEGGSANVRQFIGVALNNLGQIVDQLEQHFIFFESASTARQFGAGSKFIKG